MWTQQFKEIAFVPLVTFVKDGVNIYLGLKKVRPFYIATFLNLTKKGSN